MAELQACTSKQIPFVGWSYASARFRALAATHAPRRQASVLILGPAGVGKKAMAQAWQKAAGDSAKLPIVDLNAADEAVPHPCIATSNKALPEGLPVLDLGEGTAYKEPTAGICLVKEGRIASELASKFALRVYLGPLTFRPFDILALLYYFNRHTLPKQMGCSYQSINPQLLQFMIFRAEWIANAREVLDYLTISAVNDTQRACKGSSGLGELRFNSDMFPEESEWDEWERMTTLFGEEGVHFDELPSIAIQLYWLMCAREVGSKEIVGDYPKVHLSTRHTKPEGFIRGEWIKGCPAVDAFRQMTVEQYVDILERRFCRGTPRIALRCLGTDPDLPLSVLLGTTFSSLQDGLAINAEDVALLFDQGQRPVKVHRQRQRSRRTRRPLKLTEKEKQVWHMVHVERKNQREVAQELDCRVQNVSKLLKKAETKLAELDSRSRSVNAKPLPTDSRGQETVSDSDSLNDDAE